MPVYRGPELSAEAMQEAVREAAAAMAECKTIEALREVWRQNIGIGHRALGRLFLSECRNVEMVALKRSALAK